MRKVVLITTIVLSTLLLGYGVHGGISWWRTVHSPGATSLKKMHTLATTSDSSPDETVIAPEAAYNVPADLPRRITLPSIEADGFIQQVGVDQHQAVATPGNVHVAGWYVHSVRPGDSGLSIIDGHVQGKYEEGIFKRLAKLKKGDTFRVQFGDLSEKTFTVRSIQSYAASEASVRLFEPAPDIPRQLTLITCGGRYDAAAKQYDRRILVVAEFTK